MRAILSNEERTVLTTEALLDKLLIFQNPRAFHYRQLTIEAIRKSAWLADASPIASREYQTSFDSIWHLSKIRESAYFREKLAGDILIDLGGSLEMSHLAKDLAVKESIFVNTALAGSYRVKGYKVEPILVENRWVETLIVGVCCDLLDFLQKLPNDSVNFTINGIDKAIINVDDYHRAVAKEIVRATKPGGVVFGIFSCAIKLLAEYDEMAYVDYKKMEKQLGLTLAGIPHLIGIFEKKRS